MVASFAECKATLSSMSGIVKSKNYPNNYPHNQNCIYHIVLGKGYQIQVNITGISVSTICRGPFTFVPSPSLIKIPSAPPA